MAYEKGGRADKFGNRFEYNWILFQLLQVIDEKIDYVTIEAIGDDEAGIDLWIGKKDGKREGQQCKGRCGSSETWSYGTLNAKGIWSKWRKQLERDSKIEVSLVTPLAFPQLEDLSESARNTNGSVQDFYKYQIEDRGIETRRLYNNYCCIMGIDYEKEEGISKSINWLSRTYYRQIPDSELKTIVQEKVNMQFIGNPLDVYAKLLELVLTEDIYAQKIDLCYLNGYFKERKIEYRNLSRDDRIFPQIKRLNEEYRDCYIPFQNGLIERLEFQKCKKMIENTQSIIIHGTAGVGKSGCVENIITYLESENIPYLAIKLDKRIPCNTSEKWGESMGLPASPAFCLDAVSKNSSAFLIFDQLDALRWTQAHSGDALLVCKRIIKEVENINRDRENKISIIFVTRTFDLQNDNGIKNLFKGKEDSQDNKWDKIVIGELSEQDMKRQTGCLYDTFSQKMKKLLSISSNMFIWQRLSADAQRKSMDTAGQLINEWWKQLQEKAEELGLDSRSMLELKDKMVNFCNDNGKINIPSVILNIPVRYVDFLQSNDFIKVINGIVAFTHQSILDIFLSEHMMVDFYSGKSIIEIIGDKKRQIPGKRYQMQLFMEQLCENSQDDFLKLGKTVLASDQLRFSFKYVFLELLATLNSPSEKIKKYVCEMTENTQWGNHFIDSVIWGNKVYIDALQNADILEKWLNDTEKKTVAIRLLSSVSHLFNDKDAVLIEKYIFEEDNLKAEWSRCFSWKIQDDSDRLFELRLRFYEKYPDYLGNLFEVKSMLQECQIRTIRILALMLRHKIQKHGHRMYKYAEEFIYEDTEVLVNEYKKVNELILPLLPDVEDRASYSDWDARYEYRIGIERVCVQLLKKANANFAVHDPKGFWNTYEKYMYTGNDLYNEIILDGFYYLPDYFANDIVSYLCKDYHLTMFEATSGNGDELEYGKRLLRKVSVSCNDETYKALESTIIKFIDADAIERYKRRIEYNREKEYRVYWRFWGDFQRECLSCLPKERMSKEALQLLAMLQCNEMEYKSIYTYNNGHSGWIASPVASKKISYLAWKKIITNSNIPMYSPKRIREVEGGFIEATQEEFSRTLQTVVANEGNDFLEFILKIDTEIGKAYIGSIYSGIACSEKIDEIDTSVIEKIIKKFGYNHEDYRALDIVRIIEKKENAGWSSDIISILCDIALNHMNPEMGKPNVIPQKDEKIHLVESIESNALNSVRSRALKTIAEFISNNPNMITTFSKPIEAGIDDPNPVVRYASQFVLWPMYNIDKERTSKQLIKMYQQDIRMAGFWGSKNMLVMLYESYNVDIVEIVKKMFYSQDERLIKTAGYVIAELFILYDEFTEIVLGQLDIEKGQKEAMLDMLITYLRVDSHRDKTKMALLQNVEDNYNLEYPWTRIFYEKLIRIEEDKDFIMELLSSVLGRRVIDGFLDFLESTGSDLSSCADIVLNACKNLLISDKYNDETYWGYQDDISKMVFSLYDTQADNEEIAMECLDLWDVMYERKIGVARELTKKMMEA